MQDTDDPVKAALDIANAIRAAVEGRTLTYVGHTWGSFKAAVEQLGVRDNDTLASIEVGVRAYPTGWIHKDLDEDGGIEIREVSR